MAEKKPTPWKIKGDFLLSCNCDVFCPCVVSLGKANPTYGNCFSWWLIHVDEGHYGRVKLDGLSVGIFLEVPGPLAEGNWTVGLYIDDQATTGASKALMEIFSGRARGPTGWFSLMIANFLGSKSVPITYSKAENSWHVNIPRIIDGGVEAIDGADGGQVVVQNSRYWVAPDVVVARGTKSRIRDFGRNWDLSGQSAEFAQVDWQGP